MNIAIIPARGGSKRIPGKNYKVFCGKPMIAWAIGYAIKSNMFDKVIVSTDDERIAEVARMAGAETPFMRPTDLADDLTPTVPVVAHSLEVCQSMGMNIDNACCIYPCVPFLQITDLSDALALMKESNANFAYPVTDYVHPIQRAMRKLSNGKMEFIQGEYEMTRTQDLDRSYHDTGQFYWGKVSAWKAQMNMHTAGVGLVIPNWRVVDIDNLDDWKRAELLFKVMKKNGSE